MSDPLSHFFSHLVSAQKARILVIHHPKTLLILALLDILLSYGYIRGFRFDNHLVHILLKYKNHFPAISHILRLSKPCRPFSVSSSFFSSSSFPKHGLFILSSSSGLFSHFSAIRLRLGGEVLCHVF